MAMFQSSSFSFINYGGTDQLRIQNANDLKALELLDETFWMASSAPRKHLSTDEVLLNFLDINKTGRIRSTDIRRAANWLQQRLSDLSGVTTQAESLELPHLSSDTTTGQAIRTAAERIMQQTKTDSSTIDLVTVRKHKAERKLSRHNGDGVLLPDEIENQELREYASDILTTMKGEDDLGGQKGVGKTTIEAFQQATQELLAWQKRGTVSPQGNSDLFPFDEKTSEAFALFSHVRTAIDHYFILCKYADLQHTLDLEQEPPKSAISLLQTGQDDVRKYLSEAPLAQPNRQSLLNLKSPLNPHYQEELIGLLDLVSKKVLDLADYPSQITPAQWQEICRAFVPYETWLAEKSGGEVEKLGLAKLKEYAESDLDKQLHKLIESDLSAGKELAAVDDLEVLLLLQRWILEICRNYVNFHNLYDPDQRALFEVGRLVIAGRAFNLNIRVDDANHHSALAKESGIYLMYSEVTGKTPEETFYMVTPVTSLTVEGLGLERRGVLFDHNSRQWDVRIIKVIENPVSLISELQKPFKRIGTLVSDSFQKLSGSAEKQISSSIGDRMSKVEKSVASTIATPQPAQPKPPSPPTSTARDWMFSGSIAFAALGSSFAFISKTFNDLSKDWQSIINTLGVIGAIVVVLMIVVLIPMILIADYRLQHRNLAALLQASGWAINGEMRITRKMAKVLAPYPAHPAGIMRLGADITNQFMKRAQQAQSYAMKQVVTASQSAADNISAKVG